MTINCHKQYRASRYQAEITSRPLKENIHLGVSLARRGFRRATNSLQWILADHLSSASVNANADGSWNSTAFGEIREKSGVTETKYRYTGQLAQDVLGLAYFVGKG